MASISSAPFSLASLPNDRHPRVLEAHIVIHVLILSTAILLLMQLISHTAAAEAVESYGMPKESKKELLGMFFERTAVFSWVFIYLFVSLRSESLVPLDALHASLCIGWYADQFHQVRRERDVGKRRRATKAWLKRLRQRFSTWWNQQLGRLEGRDGGQEEERSQRPAHDIERQPSSQNSTLRNRTSSHWTSDSDNPPSSSPASLAQHTYHPFLHPAYKPLAHNLLLSLWDIIMFLTLASHIYVYVSNIKPGLAFCIGKFHYPLWHFIFLQKGLSFQARCNRVNWGIHSAGGISATGATFLALWHVCALVCRFWGGVGEGSIRRVKSGRMGKWKKKLKGRRKGDAGDDIGMADWQYPPRDVDIRSRSSLRRSIRSGTQSGTQAGAEGGERREGTLGREEMGVGMTQRRRTRKEKSDAGSDRRKESRGSRWSWQTEGFFECLA